MQLLQLTKSMSFTNAMKALMFGSDSLHLNLHKECRDMKEQSFGHIRSARLQLQTDISGTRSGGEMSF